MTDLSAFDEGTNCGMVMANFDTYYLFLDKYNFNGKTQIILLHLQDSIE